MTSRRVILFWSNNICTKKELDFRFVLFLIVNILENIKK